MVGCKMIARFSNAFKYDNTMFINTGLLTFINTNVIFYYVLFVIYSVFMWISH